MGPLAVAAGGHWHPLSATAAPAATTISRGRRRTTQPADAVTGWRIWHVRLDDDPPVLRAPYGEAPLVTGRTVRAECSVHTDHRVRWIDHAVPWSDLKCTSPEMRAAAARIECLYVADELIDHDRARRLADQLSTALGITTVVGYPNYALDDWHQRPDWYRCGGPDGLLDDEYEPLLGGERPHPPSRSAPRPRSPAGLFGAATSAAGASDGQG